MMEGNEQDILRTIREKFQGDGILPDFFFPHFTEGSSR